MKKPIPAVLLALALTGACSKGDQNRAQEQGREAGQQVEQAADQVGDAAKKTADRVGNSVEKAADEVKGEVNDAKARRDTTRH
jgi:gas vesicle protein